MNLNAFASGLTRGITPAISAVLHAKTAGYTTSPDGTQVPNVASPRTIIIDVQALSGRDLMHLDSLNIQGVVHSVYASTKIHGVDRLTQIGGDVLTFDDGDGAADWLVTTVFEAWNGAWTRVGITKQNVVTA